MPVQVTSIQITPELTSETTDWLLGNVTNKLVATITCRAVWYAYAGLAANNEDMAFVAATDVITWNGGDFENEKFFVGDTITITGSASNNGNFTITAIDGNEITVTPGLVDEASSETAIITGTTECTGINFRYNLIENDTALNFNSLIDGRENKFSKADIDYTVLTNVDMVQQGIYRSNHLGSCQVKGTNTLNEFTITHTFYIAPFLDPENLTDFLNSVSPDYFFNDNSLRYVYDIELLYKLTDPNRVHKTEAEKFLIGNAGWFDENFNGGINKFSISSLTFTNNLTSIDYIDYNAETDVYIGITSEDSVFSAGNTEFVLNHFIVPESEADYKETSTNFTENFMFDRVKQIDGAAGVNGENYGTDYQVLKDVRTTSISSGYILIHAKIALSAAYKARIAQMTDKRVVLSVSIQDHAKTTYTADLVSLKSVAVYDTDNSNDELVDITTVFNPYTREDLVMSNAGSFIEDTVRSNSIIGLDITNSATISKISVIIRAENTTDSFVLHQKDISFSGAVVKNGIQEINIEQPTGFVLKSDNPFYNYTLTRREDLDTATVAKYQLIYPFKIRWEDFIKLTGVSSDFYDTAELYNGFNNNWFTYWNTSGWDIKYIVQVTASENGYTNVINKEKTLDAVNYELPVDWGYVIRVYDIESNTEIPNNTLSDKVVRVVATFTKVSGPIPDLVDVEGVIEYEPYQQGGINIIRNINTAYEHEDGSPFESVLGNKLLKKEKNSNVYTFTANIDGKKLTGIPKLSARIYDFTGALTSFDKEFMDGDSFEFMDGDTYEFMN